MLTPQARARLSADRLGHSKDMTEALWAEPGQPRPALPRLERGLKVCQWDIPCVCERHPD